MLKLWNKFWFKEETAHTVGILRIVVGSLLTLIFIISYVNWERFYGANGIYPLSEVINTSVNFPMTLFVFNSSTGYIWLIYWVGLISAIFFTLGLLSRVANIVVYVVFVSMIHRTPMLTNGQDQVLSVALFFMLFAPTGASFSIDSIIRKYRTLLKSLKEIEPRTYQMWSIRLMWVFIAVIYFFAGPSKYFDDTAWRDGSAIYFVSLSDRWFRFYDIALFHNLIMSSLLTFFSLLIECSFAFLVWFRRTHYIGVGAIAMLHVGISVMLSPAVFFFNIAVLSVLPVFIYPEDIQKLINKLKFKKSIMLYDSKCAMCTKAMALLKAFDGNNQVELVSIWDKGLLRRFPKLKGVDYKCSITHIDNRGKASSGYAAFRKLSVSILPLKLISPVFRIKLFDKIGAELYKKFSARRARIYGYKCTVI